MRKFLKNSIVIFSLLALVMWSTPVHAANTESADFEVTSSQYLSAGDDPDLSITSDMTIEAWVKFETDPPGNPGFLLVTKRNSTGPDKSYSFDYDSTGGNRLKLEISADGSDSPQVVVTVDLNTAEWHHIAVTYDASAGSATFYVDGVQEGSTQTGLPTSIFDGVAAFHISGGDVDGTYMDGLVDDVRLWDDIRTQTEINDNKCIEIDSDTNLKGSWHLNNTLLIDSSGNGNNLTNTNSTASTTDVAHNDPLCAEEGFNDVMIISKI